MESIASPNDPRTPVGSGTWSTLNKRVTKKRSLHFPSAESV